MIGKKCVGNKRNSKKKNTFPPQTVNSVDNIGTSTNYSTQTSKVKYVRTQNKASHEYVVLYKEAKQVDICPAK